MATGLRPGPGSEGRVSWPKLQVVGVAGHRRFGNPTTGRFVAQACHSILRRIRRASPDCVALSPLAEGTDTAFAHAALGLGMALDVIRPHARFGDDFSTAHAKRRYRLLRRAARRRVDLAFDCACDDAFEAAMTQVVRSCDLLVVAWDGEPARGRGGTAQAVMHAMDLGRAWIHVDTRHGLVRPHGVSTAAGPTRLQHG